MVHVGINRSFTGILILQTPILMTGLTQKKRIEISVGFPSLSSQDSNNNGTRMCFSIDTNISNNLDVPFENHDTISPLSCATDVIGDLNEKIVMDV